jgi:isopentenyl phosphate kinase
VAENEKKERPPSFAAMLAQIRPRTDVELAEGLQSVIEAVKATGKAGRITVAFEVKPADGMHEAVVVNDKIALKLPEKTREGSMAFVTRDGGLSRTDPSAMPLFTDEDDIRDAGVDPATGEIKEAPGA